MLLLFLDDIKSETELMQIIPERLDYLWFLGYGPDDEIPRGRRWYHHARDELGGARLRRTYPRRPCLRNPEQCATNGRCDRRCSSGAQLGEPATWVGAQAAQYVAAGVLCLASGLALAASKDWHATPLRRKCVFSRT